MPVVARDVAVHQAPVPLRDRAELQATATGAPPHGDGLAGVTIPFRAADLARTRIAHALEQTHHVPPSRGYFLGGLTCIDFELIFAYVLSGTASPARSIRAIAASVSGSVIVVTFPPVQPRDQPSIVTGV